jgi:hypothetical protein
MALVASACSGPAHVRFDRDACFIDGRTATLMQVEVEEAKLSERILNRQPLFVLVTMMVVALAGASYVERLLLVLSLRKRDAPSLADRLQKTVERYRMHPLRYFSIVGATFALLLAACGFYIYLDADKRASERSLGLLQFCHLALRTAQEQSVLSEQRQNLSALQSTAGDIRALVDKLPPGEQKDAQHIVEQIGAALDKQGKIVADSFERTSQVQGSVRDETALVERGISSVAADVGGLKSMPATLRDLGASLAKIDADVRALDARIGVMDGRLTAIDQRMTDATRVKDDAVKAVIVAKSQSAASQPAAKAKP